MKVLWLCNTMLPVVAEQLQQKASNKEGWLSGLCDSLLKRQKENHIELHVAFPVERSLDGLRKQLWVESGCLFCYGFWEDITHPEQYDEGLNQRLLDITRLVEPDVVHCFGTEFPHHLAMARCFPHPERILVGIQGICSVIAQEYMADLPLEIQTRKSFRDYVKRDGLTEQQQKFRKRGIHERELLGRVENIAGRTEFDRYFVQKVNPHARYFVMNETMRECFYEGQWDRRNCKSHTIFVSQGDYPLKGLHYLLLASAKLKEQYPDLQVRVGGNSLVHVNTLKDRMKMSGYGNYLYRLIRKLNLEANVTFLGKLSAEEMKREYLACGLYVCCSANENSPNSLAEAMLLGVPCVASDVGGIPSLFSHGKDGILYETGHSYEKIINNICDETKEQGDTLAGQATCEEKESGLQQNVTNLIQAIVTIWENPQITDAFCENARKHARKTHDKEENYSKMVEIYAKIAEGKNLR